MRRFPPVGAGLRRFRSRFSMHLIRWPWQRVRRHRKKPLSPLQTLGRSVAQPGRALALGLNHGFWPLVDFYGIPLNFNRLRRFLQSSEWTVLAPKSLEKHQTVSDGSIRFGHLIGERISHLFNAPDLSQKLAGVCDNANSDRRPGPGYVPRLKRASNSPTTRRISSNAGTSPKNIASLIAWIVRLATVSMEGVRTQSWGSFLG